MKLPKNNIIDRISLLKEKVSGKNVLHIGFTDFPFTEKKYNEGSLLHMQLAGACNNIVGIDLDKQSVEFLHSKGIENIYVCNIYVLDECEELMKYSFDFILFSEVIEHLPNPELALNKIYNFIIKNNPRAKLIITAPNINNFIFRFTDTFKNVERVHPDHYFYFSYSTLSKLVNDNGFVISDFKYILYRDVKAVFKLLPQFLNIFSSSFMPYLFFECEIKGKQCLK